MVYKDLFGNEIEQPIDHELSKEEDYRKYINSAQWKRKCKAKIKLARNKCEKCCISGYSIKLQVHHLTYDHFKHEKMDELQVLCPNCHHKADEKRKKEIEVQIEEANFEKGFETWMILGYGVDWEENLSYDEILDQEDKFREWLYYENNAWN